MDIGPVEYIAIGFPGNKFSGQIVPAIQDLVQNGTVRILDLVFVGKDDDGNIVSFEYDELEAAIEEALGYDAIEGDAGGFLSDEDVEAAGDLLEPGSSAVLIVWEDLWAKDLAVAIRGADGVILAGGRIAQESIEYVLESIEQA